MNHVSLLVCADMIYTWCRGLNKMVKICRKHFQVRFHVWTRPSENDNTPQPLDQWTNSPFMGQQVGNCKVSYWPITWRSISHPLWPKSKPTVRPTFIVPNSHLFHFKPFLKYGYQKFDFENPRSKSWVRSKFKVTTSDQHPIDSHPFGSMTINPLVPMIELF